MRCQSSLAGIRKTLTRVSVVAVAAVSALAETSAIAQQAHPDMTFFVTSRNPGRGANLGGLKGADAYCQRLAARVGAGGKTWRAYLSTKAANGQPAVNARDRIGKGPWHNSKGQLIALDIQQLHTTKNRITKDTALDERGRVVTGRGDRRNRHDILTGSDTDGTLMPGEKTTCRNWTSSSSRGSARVGHHDRLGLVRPGLKPTSWNSAHGSRGCSLRNLRGTGGDGLFYCFAITE